MSKLLNTGKPERKHGVFFEKQRDDPEGFVALSDKEKAAIREKAKLMVANELKAREETALLDQYLAEERKAVDPQQQLIPIFLNLAGHSEYIMLDGVQYFHQQLHHVTPNVFAVLAEQQARGWAHEEETEVRDTRTRRRNTAPSHVGIGNFTDNRNPRNLTVSSGQLQGAAPAALLGIGP